MMMMMIKFKAAITERYSRIPLGTGRGTHDIRGAQFGNDWSILWAV
jgi:hypothetical protein